MIGWSNKSQKITDFAILNSLTYIVLLFVDMFLFVMLHHVNSVMKNENES